MTNDPNYGPRYGGAGEKGSGYFGPLTNSAGDVVTEYGVGVEINGVETEIPSIVPTLSASQLQAVLDASASDSPPPPDVIQAATDFAEQRIAQGLSPFAQPGEQQAPPKKPDLGLDINLTSPTTSAPSWFSDLAHLEDNWIHQTSPWTGARWEDGGGALQVIRSGSDVIQQFVNLKVPKKAAGEEATPDVLNPNTALILQAVRIAGTPVDHSAKPIGPAESLGGPEKVGQGLVLIPQSAWLARKSAPDFVLEKIDDELWDQSLNAGDSEIYTYTFPAKASGQLVLINYAYSNIIQDGDFSGQIDPKEFDPSYIDPMVTPPGPSPNYIDTADTIDATPIISFIDNSDDQLHFYSWSPIGHFWWKLVDPGQTLIVTQKWGPFPSSGDAFPNYQYKTNLHAWVISHEGGGALTVKERPRNGMTIDTFTSRTDPSPSGGDPIFIDDVVSSMGGSSKILVDWIAYRSCFAAFTSIPDSREVMNDPSPPDPARSSLKAVLRGSAIKDGTVYEDIGRDILTNQDFTASRTPGGKNYPSPGDMGFINAIRIANDGGGQTYPLHADYLLPNLYALPSEFGVGGFPGMAIGATVTTFEIGVT